MNRDCCTRCGAAIPWSRFAGCPRCLAEADIAPALIGGQYELVQEIGRGGMGSVWRARDLRLDRPVAVKLLPEELYQQEEFRRRFEREARALARLSHPNIVAIHDFGEQDGQAYIVMEFVPNGSLAGRLPLPPSESCRLLRQACEALDYAHRQGIVHRDVKPSNLLLHDSGHLKVGDFGIARWLGEAQKGWTVTAADRVMGTPRYVAPEAREGNPPDPRMDVWSLGIVLHEMITGRVPEAGLGKVSPELMPILKKALAEQPASRYASARDMARDLAHWAGDGTAVSGRPVLEPHERAWLYGAAAAWAVATAVGLFAFLRSVTPKVIPAEEALPLVALGEERLTDGRILTHARFEVWWSLAAIVAIALAGVLHGLLRLHWRRALLEAKMPERPVPQSRLVLIFGLISLAAYGLRLGLEAAGHTTSLVYIPVLGGAILATTLLLFWAAILEALRTGRSLRREPALWVGMSIAVAPAVRDLITRLAQYDH